LHLREKSCNFAPETGFTCQKVLWKSPSGTIDKEARQELKKRKAEMRQERIHPLEKFSFCPVCGSKNWVVNNEKSKRCEDCGFVYYANPSSATAAFIVRRCEGAEVRGYDGAELLVVRRAKEPAKGTLDLPGGFLDMYETGEEGILREIREETGLVLTDCRYLFSIPNSYDYSGMTIHTLDMFFRCDVDHDAAPHAADDAAECFWLPLDSIQPEEFGLTSIRQAVIRFINKSEE
jgi:ADP-ribose pyrophosphatase YjhB (NUDIX family)